MITNIITLLLWTRYYPTYFIGIIFFLNSQNNLYDCYYNYFILQMEKPRHGFPQAQLPRQIFLSSRIGNPVFIQEYSLGWWIAWGLKNGCGSIIIRFDISGLFCSLPYMEYVGYLNQGKTLETYWIYSQEPHKSLT